MKIVPSKLYASHGSGIFSPEQLGKIGKNVIFEPGVLIFHPENVKIGDNVYIGHNTILKAYHKNYLIIGDHSWIGQNCFLHSAGGIEIGRGVGIGPMVTIISSKHLAERLDVPVMFTDLRFAPVVLCDGCDIGVGAILLPGVTIGEGAVVGAGAVVTRNIPDFEVWAGVPAKFIRKR